MSNITEIANSKEFAAIGRVLKGKLKGIINLELVPEEVTEGETVPNVKSRLVFDKKDEQWAARLRSKRHVVTVAGEQSKKIHTYMVGYGGRYKYPDNTNRSMPFAIRMLVIGYYQNDTGDEEDNAEEAFEFELAQLAYAFLNTPKLNYPGFVKDVVDFRERRELTRIGEVQVIESIAELIIQLHVVPKRNQ